ncbi:hypothetical protein Fleli_2247 [Bernardetia litoralis DSM 6794]|uniref:PrcB C-terminal domain-containing protein n=1 Tax=Bernardetia litoralis (strain ATCC 23117 / DSM 6794 / NBRC 15988 / NCIMB 1366 / Fx l1 / Sio-4) TaxID=880071 RepID=I4AKY9_BERLS|nr:hypothetical protein [Bernardetia litoralis]AFM04624.1 hypothetical protein Fleli_2247 [Bernardetia litoralis DSM 6794]
MSCQSDEITPEASKEITFTKGLDFLVVAQGNLNGSENIEKSNLIIQDNTSWEGLIIKMNSIKDVSDKFTETNIDFSSYTLIVVFDEVYGNGGHSIDVINVTENDFNVIVKLDRLLEGNLASVTTQPFQIIKIPKTTKQIIFE